MVQAMALSGLPFSPVLPTADNFQVKTQVRQVVGPNSARRGLEFVCMERYKFRVLLFAARFSLQQDAIYLDDQFIKDTKLAWRSSPTH
jgi:hypothetical protein